MRRKNVVLHVKADLPEDVEPNEIAGFVIDALETWGGQRRPPGAYGEHVLGDPLFHSLKVHAVRIGSTTYANKEVPNG